MIVVNIKNIAYWAALNFFFNRHDSSYRDNYKHWYLILTILVLSISGHSLIAQDSLVGGTLEEDQVWTNEYTYIVYKDIRIPEGITLSIQAGVTVKIDQGRGIFVLGGNMTVDGQHEEVIDSVNFMANHTSHRDGWKWKGISFTGVGGANMNYFSYANIVDAEIAFDIYNSEEVYIENSCILNNQNIGIRLFNSRHCDVVNSLLQNNYDGIEMVATDANETSDNLVKNCILKNANHNIYLLKAYGGIFVDNLLESNLIEGGNNGIWVDNGGGEAFGKNAIHKNVFVDNGGEEGYALLLAQDSITVTNNIFWKNNIAIFYDQYTTGSIVAHNSFYQNNESILLSSGSLGHEFRNNTFSMNEISAFNFSETGEIFFNHNNIIAISGQEKVIVNNTPDDINIEQSFWNTTSDSEIQQMIYDKNDDPALGLVIYDPFLTDADTTNPVAPPLSLIKQSVDGKVKLSWLPNPEIDLRAYKAYYGGFENYSFPLVTEAITDTVYFLSGVDIFDSVAVTAVDSATQLIDAQLSGHESPFAFAAIYPYAGPDSKICKMHTEFHLEESTIPFEYDVVSWSTDGDGTFNDPAILHPVYYPGLTDKLNGKVVLTIGVKKDGVKIYDSLTLFIYDDPVVFAGNDTIIFADAQLELLTASALDYDTIRWATTGDGVYDSDTLLHPLYTPGNADIAAGSVDLVMMGISECGMASDTLRLFLEPFFSLEGKVWHNGQPVHNGVILAVKDDVQGARAVDITYTEPDGYFLFDKLMEGNYYIYAVPDTLTQNGTVPGYYAHKLKWQNAHYFNVYANTYDVDIMLPSVDYQLPAGEGSISGYFITPASSMFAKDIYCNSWFEEDNLEYCNGGLSNITVFLYNTSGTKLLDYTLTDEIGHFYFNNLPYGNYIVDAEKASYQTSVSSLITLSPDHQNETNIVLELTGDRIDIFGGSGKTPHSAALAVYPNPTNHFLHVPVSEDMSGTAIINIYNSMGHLVFSEEAMAGNNIWQVSSVSCAAFH